MKITCEFRGGLDQIFKQNDLDLEIKDNTTIRDLVDILAQNHVKRTPELFTKEKAGILVLINDTDWELLDCYDYEIQDKDTIGFISTLHGG